MTTAPRETDVVVLDCKDHGESDLIVTLYGPDTGRFSAIAKGAKRSQKRFVNKLEIFSFLHIHLRISGGRSLALLEEAELHAGFINLRKSLVNYTAASVLREVILLAIREGEGDQQLFRLILWALHTLDQAQPHLQVVMLFLLRFYDLLGYKPEFACCTGCGAKVTSERNCRFSIVNGGLDCGCCGADHSLHLIPLTGETAQLLENAQLQQLKHLHQLQIPTTCLYESLNILHRYGRHILQREIISWKMLRKTHLEQMTKTD